MRVQPWQVAVGRPPPARHAHRHFDHTGSIGELMDRREVPAVYAHPEEMPYLTNQEEYPPPDPLVGGGMAPASPLFPRGPIDLQPRIRELPADGSVPGMPGWHGPPQYFTPDGQAARESVQHLASLRPSLAATGHGVPLAGMEMLSQLDDLARNFEELAVPRHGKHAHHDHRAGP